MCWASEALCAFVFLCSFSVFALRAVNQKSSHWANKFSTSPSRLHYSTTKMKLKSHYIGASLNICMLWAFFEILHIIYSIEHLENDELSDISTLKGGLTWEIFNMGSISVGWNFVLTQEIDVLIPSATVSVSGVLLALFWIHNGSTCKYPNFCQFRIFQILSKLLKPGSS